MVIINHEKKMYQNKLYFIYENTDTNKCIPNNYGFIGTVYLIDSLIV